MPASHPNSDPDPNPPDRDQPDSPDADADRGDNDARNGDRDDDGMPSLVEGDLVLAHSRPARIMRLDRVDYRHSSYRFRVGINEWCMADGEYVAAMLARGHWERIDVDASPFLIDPDLPDAAAPPLPGV